MVAITVKYYAALRNNEIMQFYAISMELGEIMLISLKCQSEINQKDKYRMFLFPFDIQSNRIRESKALEVAYLDHSGP